MPSALLPGSSATPSRFTAIAGALLVSGIALPGSTANAATTTTTTMTLTAGGSPITTVSPHTVITLTATVKAGPAALKTGQVRFCDAAATYCEDNHRLGVSQLTQAGSASLRFTPAPGSHSYKAAFVGTTSNQASQSAASSLQVTEATVFTTGTRLSATGASGSYTLTGSVTGVGTTKSPTGNLYFLDRSNANYEIGKAALPAGMPQLNYTGLPNSWLEPKFDQQILNMVAADFNNDGHPDLVLANGAYIPTIALGRGDGTFTEVPSATKSINDDSPALALADFNEDGALDIVATDGEDLTHIYLGNGDGTFAPGVKLALIAGSHKQAVVYAAGDFNADGHPDLLVNYNGTTVGVLLGHGDGTFQPGWESTLVPGGYLSGGFYQLQSNDVIGDFNGDGKVDFVDFSYSRNDSTLAVFLGQGDGTFQRTDYRLARSGTFGLGDFNGDGRTDIAFGDFGNGISNNAALVFLSQPDGSFSQQLFGPLYGSPFNTFAADFNGDGLVDVAFSEISYPDQTYPQEVFLNNGDGSFTKAERTESSKKTTLLQPTVYAVGDFNGDGLADVAGFGYNANEAGYPYAYGALLSRTTTLASVTVNGKSPIGAGTHDVVARYEGDDTFTGSASKAVSLVAASSAPAATLSTAALQFSTEQPLGVPSPAKTVVLSNTGNAPLVINSIAIAPSAGGGSSFAVSNNCPASLAAGAACTLRLRFVPSSAGPKVSQLLITDNAGNSPQAVTLSGKSAGNAHLTLSATVLLFPPQPPSVTSAVKTVILTNSGTAKFDLGSITIQGYYADQFVTSNNCYEGLAVGASCTIRVRYTPHHNYAQNPATFLLITGDADNAPLFVGLNGEAIGQN